MLIEITDPGLLATIQDQGRMGYAHLGVPRAGALDRRSADLANRLVGNNPTDAVLETTLTGMSFTVAGAVTIAVTGAQAFLTVNSHERAFAEPVSVSAGARVTVGPARVGVRSYVAFGGGVDVTPVLGSRSTDTLAFVGPKILNRGVSLPIGDPVGDPVEAPPTVTARIGRASEATRLRVHAGPRRFWFGPDALEGLCSASYVVTAASNRIGLRLSGRRPTALIESRRELASEGIVVGAIQIPPDGQPVVFLNDHPTTGGYPVIGVVEPADLDLCAQLPPGSSIEFSLV